FSADFWPAESRSVFAADTTALVEAIPRPPRGPLMITKGVDEFFAPQALVAPQFAHVSADNWIPADRTATFYAFDGSAAALRPFYENLLCGPRVRGFGQAFLVEIEPQEWGWMSQHGWRYEATCNGGKQEAIVPTLSHVLSFHLECGGSTHVWRGRWVGPT